jgi:hypothetical protein
LLATAAVFAAGSASAQTAQQTDLDTVKVEQMQRQMQQLQDQMKQVNKDLAEAKKKAAAANGEIPPAFNGAYGADLKPFPTKAPSIIDKVKLTWGGYFSADAVWREHSTLNDSNTTFSAIPYPFSPLYRENEFRASARQSRISLLVEGPLSNTQKLSGYFEMDFQGAAPTANFNQSNGWTPRLRQGFLAYDNINSGFHFLAGQAWSLVTQTTVDMTPRKENVPIGIDAGYVPGFDFTRNWQVRFVQDIAPWISVGASVEAPAAIVGANGSLQTITAVHGLVGAILHPWAGLDIYGYAGIEKEQSGVWANLAGTGGVSGFGVPNLVNAGCYITTSASFTGGTSNCAAVNKLVSGDTLGFWQDVYKGPMGRVATGLQYEWIHRESFAGYGVVAASTAGPALAGIGAVHTDDSMVLGPVRWYPF